MLACRCKERDGPVINRRVLARLVPQLPVAERRKLWREARGHSRHHAPGPLNTLSSMYLGPVQHVAGLYVSPDLTRAQSEECLDRLVRAGNVGLEKALVQFCQRPHRRQRDFILFSLPFVQRAIEAVLTEEKCCVHQRRD